jgi:hypothetical protein
MSQVLPLFVDEVPEYEARGEVMFVRWKGLEIALPISVCSQACLLCGEELAKWRVSRLYKASVIEFPAH